LNHANLPLTPGSAVSRSTKERFVVALAADKMAGGPFERFLEE